MKRKMNNIDFLKSIKLSLTAEQKIIDDTIKQLENKSNNEYSVMSNMNQKFRKLASHNKLSQEGLELFTELQKPNFNEDVALSSMTWFTSL